MSKWTASQKLDIQLSKVQPYDKAEGLPRDKTGCG